MAIAKKISSAFYKNPFFMLDDIDLVYYKTITPTWKDDVLMLEWNKNQPIFMQIRHQIVEMILSEAVKAGEALPSVRQLAVQLSVNPLTVTKAYQSLVDLDLIEKKRGLGMFVKDETREELLKIEKAQFLKEEWPPIEKRLEILNISLDELMKKGG